MTGAPWRATPEGVIVTCRLTPRGGSDAIDGVKALADGSRVLMVRVRAAPEDGRANEALRAVLAETLGAPLSRVSLIAGTKSRTKQIAIAGDAEALAARLTAL